MSKVFSTTAILIRRLDYGENDFILTFLSEDLGKITVIAKSAKKSVKRFAGVLELFSCIHLVCRAGRGRLPVLQEASLETPFDSLRADIKKTAYASYWAEVIHEWLEEDSPPEFLQDHKSLFDQETLFDLYRHVLASLDARQHPPEALSLLFQMRFMALSGFSPNLSACSLCKKPLESLSDTKIQFDLSAGGLVCGACARFLPHHILLSKGTAKQLIWLQKNNLNTAARLRLSQDAITEGLVFLESFLPHHLGKKFKSLDFLRRIR